MSRTLEASAVQLAWKREVSGPSASDAAWSGWMLLARANSTSSVSVLFGSGTQQSTGQTSAHCSLAWKPTHSVHRRGLMTKVSSPSLIASFGHSGSQTPQLMHSSVIMVDIGG